MTSIPGLAPETARTTATVTVALVSASPYLTESLVAALTARPSTEIAQWRLLRAGAVDALDAGAHVCVRGSDSALVAAYLHSIARRRGLFSEDAAR